MAKKNFEWHYFLNNNFRNHHSNLSGSKKIQRINWINKPSFCFLPRLDFFVVLFPIVLVFRVIQPPLLSVVVCRSDPSLFHEEDCVRVFLPPKDPLDECVNRVRVGDFVVVVRVVPLVFFVVRLFAMIFWPKKILVRPSIHSIRLLWNSMFLWGLPFFV